MRHLIILGCIGFLFGACATDQSSDTSVYDKHPEVLTDNSNSSASNSSALEPAAEEESEMERAEVEAQQKAETEALAKAEEEKKKKMDDAAKKRAAEIRAREKARATAAAEAAKKQAAANASKTDTRIRPTPREDKISTTIVSNPKTASSTPRPPATKPIFRWSTKVHDFGWVKEGDKVKFSYHFTNVGSEPLIILEANADCGCTVPSYSKKPVPPGGSGSLDVIFDTKSKAGRQDKKITILANTIPNYTDLRIQGMVDNRPKKEDAGSGGAKGNTTASSGGTTTQSGSQAKAGGSLLDKLKNKVEKDGE